MARHIVSEIAALHSNGWRPFTGMVDVEVYSSLPCAAGRTGGTEQGQEQVPLLPQNPQTAQAPQNAEFVAPKKTKKPAPYWFFCGDVYLCLGCQHRCSLTRPKGFQCVLPLRYNPAAEKYTLTPQEMLKKLNQLTIKQAAYCLNISYRQVYRLIQSGKLPRTRTDVMRVPVLAVRELLEEMDD